MTHNTYLEMAIAREKTIMSDIVPRLRNMEASARQQYRVEGAYTEDKGRVDKQLCVIQTAIEALSVLAETSEQTVHEVEVRKYQCPDCMNRFWVDCDDTDYPTYCPFCGADHDATNGGNEFSKEQTTNKVFERSES